MGMHSKTRKWLLKTLSFALFGFCFNAPFLFAEQSDEEPPRLIAKPEPVSECVKLETRIRKLINDQNEQKKIDKIELKLLQDEKENKCSPS